MPRLDIRLISVTICRMYFCFPNTIHVILIYFILQFSSLAYNRIVKPKQEVTFSYQFFVSDAYSPRPYGLTINLYYRDADNVQYLTPVFNETVNIFELDEGLDSETFFLFIVLGGLAVLALVGIYQLFQSYGVSSKCLFIKKN